MQCTVDPELLEEAKTALGTATPGETIERSLRDAVRRSKLRRAAVIGTMESFMTRDELLAIREQEAHRLDRRG